VARDNGLENSPFNLVARDDEYAVTWREDRYYAISDATTKVKCLSRSFEYATTLDDVGFMVQVGSVYWISPMAYLSLRTDEERERMTDSLLRDYNIRGTVYKNLASAENFLNYLEKQYMWHTLKTP
jgi:hypothetical protein